MKIYNPQVTIGNVNRELTKISDNTTAGLLMIADGRLFSIKGRNSQRNKNEYSGITLPIEHPLKAGLLNAFEIPFPNESANLIDANGIGGEGAYALFDNGNLYTWGANETGQLGLGDKTVRYTPQLAAVNVAKVFTHPSNAGGSRESGRLFYQHEDGWVYGTGENKYGELGIGDRTDRTTFIQCTWMGRNPKSVWNLGTYHGATVVQKSDNSIWVAGANLDGALGIGNTNVQSTGIDSGESTWLGNDPTFEIKKICYQSRWYSGTLDPNAKNSMIMLLDNGSMTRLVGSGYNAYGTLGRGNTANISTPQAPIGMDLTHVKDFITKADTVGSTYVLLENGELWAYGYNQHGNLGDGTTTTRSTPSIVLTDVLEIPDSHQAIQIWGYRTPSPIVRTADGYFNTGVNIQFSLGTGNMSNEQVTTSWQKIRLPRRFESKFFGVINSGTNRITRIAIDLDNNIYAWGDNDDDMLDTYESNHVSVPLLYSPPALKS